MSIKYSKERSVFYCTLCHNIVRAPQLQLPKYCKKCECEDCEGDGMKFYNFGIRDRVKEYCHTCGGTGKKRNNK